MVSVGKTKSSITRYINRIQNPQISICHPVINYNDFGCNY